MLPCQVFFPTPLLPGVSPVRGEEEPSVWLARHIMGGEHASLLAGVWWLSSLRGRLMLDNLRLASGSL